MSQKMLQRRQSSKEIRVGERLEMRDLHGKLIVHNGGLMKHNYGTTNVAFDDSTSPRHLGNQTTADLGAGDTVTAISPSAGDDREFRCSNTEADEERESWDSKLQFFLATVGYAVGLGSVWRFPYLAQKNGGGAFLIPYMIMLCIEGIPMFYLELAIGQRLRKGAIGVWHQVSSYLGGIGIASAIVSFNVALYYNTIIAWCLFYFFQSFQAQLPWSECPKQISNNTLEEVPECTKSSPTQYFWYRVTLDVSPNVDTAQQFNWRIALCLFIAWILCYLCMIKGIASSGKVVYVTAPFPYVVLVIFFFRGMTLPGMKDGVAHLFTPQWSKLADPVVWLEAGTQIFFSMGLAFGGLIAFSSYNPVHNNCFRDAVTLSLTNCATAMFAAIVVFSVLGFKAHMNHEKCLTQRDNTLLHLFNTTKLDDIPVAGTSITPVWGSTSIPMPELPICDLQQELEDSASGTGLAFIAFTEAINQFPGAPFWAVLFFLMLFTLGIDSQFGTLEGAVTSIVDLKLFPNLRKEILTGSLCLFSFLISLIFAHGAGNYIFTMFDDFAGNIPLLLIAFFECISVAYVYGVKRFCDDIELMTGSRPGNFWVICWKFVSPVAMICILVSSLVKIAQDGSTYEAWIKEEGRTESLEWPLWANIVIAFLILVSALWIPGVALAKVLGWPMITDDTPAWFPADELREFYNIEPHKVTTCERWLFCMQEDDEQEDEV